MKLLSVNADAKTSKGSKKGYLTGILYLAPADISGNEVCPMRSQGCTEACLYTAGRGGFSNVQASRIRKTRWYFDDRMGFLRQLVKDIQALIRKAEREGLTPVVRLNGTSDIPWERVRLEPAPGLGLKASTMMEIFPDVQFYDYTKIEKRALDACRSWGDWPANYHLTFSANEANRAAVWRVLGAGGNAAVVFRDKVPSGYVWPARSAWDHVPVRYDVVDGDETDLRFLDKKSVIVGLKAKGDAKKDTSGFVWDRYDPADL